MKILFVATVRSHIGEFHMPFIRALKERGCEVHAAYKDNSADKPGLDLTGIDKVFEVPFERSPFKKENIEAYKVLKKIIEAEKYDIIHCHTPMGGVVTRLAARSARKNGTKVFYTAHGFHFYKGAPLKNWLMYYPMEKFCARFTDVLITINNEDYALAKKKRFAAKQIVKVNGVGVDLSQFSVATEDEKQKFRKAYGYKKDDFILLYAADYSKRKNQPMLLRAVARLKEKIPNLILLLAGQPILQKEYEEQCKELGTTDKVKFLGYRRDIDKLLALCDCVVSSSRQEGLPLNLIEAAARGKYIIATDVRGNADVVKQCGYGELVPLNDDIAQAKEIERVYREHIRTNCNKEKIMAYDVHCIIDRLLAVYGIQNDIKELVG